MKRSIFSQVASKIAWCKQAIKVGAHWLQLAISEPLISFISVDDAYFIISGLYSEENI